MDQQHETGLAVKSRFYDHKNQHAENGFHRGEHENESLERKYAMVKLLAYHHCMQLVLTNAPMHVWSQQLQRTIEVTDHNVSKLGEHTVIKSTCVQMP